MANEFTEMQKVGKELRGIDVEIRFMELDMGQDDDFYKII